MNDIRDLDAHRNNGITTLVESRRLKDSGDWVSTQRDIISAYGLLSLQHRTSEAYMYIKTNKHTQSGYIYMRATD